MISNVGVGCGGHLKRTATKGYGAMGDGTPGLLNCGLLGNQTSWNEKIVSHSRQDQPPA